MATAAGARVAIKSGMIVGCTRGAEFDTGTNVSPDDVTITGGGGGLNVTTTGSTVATGVGATCVGTTGTGATGSTRGAEFETGMSVSPEAVTIGAGGGALSVTTIIGSAGGAAGAIGSAMGTGAMAAGMSACSSRSSRLILPSSQYRLSPSVTTRVISAFGTCVEPSGRM